VIGSLLNKEKVDEEWWRTLGSWGTLIGFVGLFIVIAWKRRQKPVAMPEIQETVKPLGGVVDGRTGREENPIPKDEGKFEESKGGEEIAESGSETRTRIEWY
jgi:hypothetical protein